MINRTTIQYLGFICFCGVILMIQHKKEMDLYEKASKAFKEGYVEGVSDTINCVTKKK